MRQLIIASTLLCLAGAPVHAAGVYRWVDQDGNVHYGDKAIENAEKLDNDKPPAPEAAAEKSENLLAAEARAKKCDLARQRLAQYQEANTIYSEDEFGKRTELTPEEQVQSIVEMQKNVDAYCGTE